MSNYVDVVKTDKRYQGNVVIQIGATSFAIREPDSGLAIDSPYDKCVLSLLLNPTQIDLDRVTTTISTFSFRLVDKNGIISALVLGDAAPLIGQAVRIYIGRSGVDMDFSEYFQLPITYVKKCDHSDNSYNFSTSEQTDRMDKPIYNFVSALGVDILSGTTIITMRDSLASFPLTGFLKVEDEFMSYTGVDLVNNRFTGVIRGELNSTPADHKADNDVMLVETVTDNPLNIILKVLISGGGGGTYDTLQDGLGIDESLIDVAGIEALRDDLFFGESYTLSLYGIASALKLIETELLMSNNLRFTNSSDSKVSLAILDKARFIEDEDVIDEDSITKYPQWTIDSSKVTNIIQVDWDFNEATQLFQARNIYQDDDSIALYDAQTPLTFQFKGIKSASNGQALVDDFGQKLLARLSTPTPVVTVNTHIDKSLENIGDKTYVESSKIPAADGTLNFASELEVVSRSINITSGDVQFKLAFTSFTNIRSGFIAPSDTFLTKVSQSKITVAAGRSSYYTVGWKMRLYNNITGQYESDAINTILAIDESTDTITFQNAWSTTVVPVTHKMRFADYDDVVESQKRYCFVSAGGADFPDGKQTYKVTY